MPPKRRRVINRLKFEHPHLIKPPDLIISSKARELGNGYGFTPTYFQEKATVTKLLSGEYGRYWFDEREVYLTDTFLQHEKTVIDQTMKRRFVQRMMVCPKTKQRTFPVIHLKRFQNIAAKVDHKRSDEEIKKICPPKKYEENISYRYKAQCKN